MIGFMQETHRNELLAPNVTLVVKALYNLIFFLFFCKLFRETRSKLL
jgi:hypothetical protein